MAKKIVRSVKGAGKKGDPPPKQVSTPVEKESPKKVLEEGSPNTSPTHAPAPVPHTPTVPTPPPQAQVTPSGAGAALYTTPTPDFETPAPYSAKSTSEGPPSAPSFSLEQLMQIKAFFDSKPSAIKKAHLDSIPSFQSPPARKTTTTQPNATAPPKAKAPPNATAPSNVNVSANFHLPKKKNLSPTLVHSTAGSTPFDLETKMKKREGTGQQSVRKCMRNLAGGKTMLSHLSQARQNKFYFMILPDGVIVGFAAKGSANGEPGYLQPPLKWITQMLEGGGVVSSLKVTAVFPVRERSTNEAKTIWFANKTRSMTVMCIAYQYLMVTENTIENGEQWAIKLVRTFNQKFPDMRLTYGGNAIDSGVQECSSLDEFLMTEDVANLAFTAYEPFIRDGSFFDDVDLFNLYFANSGGLEAVKAIFFNIFGIQWN